MKALFKASLTVFGLAAAATATTAAAQLGLARADRMMEAERNQLQQRDREAHTRRFKLDNDEFRAFKNVENALAARNYERAATALADARKIAVTPDGKYAIAALQLQLGLATGEVPLQNEAVDAVLASRMASVDSKSILQRRQGLGAIWEGDYDKAEAAFNDFRKKAPDKVDPLILLAETKYRMNEHAEALALLEQAITLETKAKRHIPARWIRARETLLAKTQNGAS